jgi:TPR repeat protein
MLLSFAQALSASVAWSHGVTAESTAQQSAVLVSEARRKAASGDPHAQVELGDWYCFGTYRIKVNLKSAVEWYLKAARLGNTEAEQKISEMYEFGYGVRLDHARALEWIRKATARDPDSAMRIALDYWTGQRISASQGCSHLERIPKDPAKAIEWYRIAADAGSDHAETALGEMYESEPAVQSFEEALRWYRLAAQTSSWAMGDLAHLYATGTGVPQDFGEAAKWYLQAVERGPYPTHRYELGLLYEKGLGVPQDRQKAMELYAYAAANGISDAQQRLFALYEADLNLPSDPSQAIAWYEAAAEAGNRRAQVGLGLHYQYGKGVPGNGAVARALYVLAQQSPGGQGDVPSFVVPKSGSRFSGTDVALAMEMAKPGNLLQAIKRFLARPQESVLEE